MANEIKKLLLGALFVATFACLSGMRATAIVDGGFEAGAPRYVFQDFSQCGGNWFANLGELVLSKSSGTILNDKITFKDGEIFADIKVGKSGEAGVLFNALPSDGELWGFAGYAVLISRDAQSGFLNLKLVRNEKDSEVKTEYRTSQKAEGWQKLHIMISKAGLHVYAGGEEIVALADFKPLRIGRVGFIGVDADANFRACSVNGVKMRFFGSEAPSISAGWIESAGSKNAQFYHDDERGFEGKCLQEISAKNGSAGILNSKKISVEKSGAFKGSAALRSGNINGKFYARMLDAKSGRILAETEIKNIGKNWNVFNFELAISDSSEDARFGFFLEGSGAVEIDAAVLKF